MTLIFYLPLSHLLPQIPHIELFLSITAGDLGLNRGKGRLGVYFYIHNPLAGEIVSEYDLFFTTNNFQRDSEQFPPQIQKQHQKFFQDLYRK